MVLDNIRYSIEMYLEYIAFIMYTCEQPPLFGKERNSLWMETFFFQIHRAYENEVGGNPKTR